MLISVRHFKVSFLIVLLNSFLFSCANIERVNSSKPEEKIATRESQASSENQELAFRSPSSSRKSQSQALNPALESLISQAASQESSGDIAGAASTIERALRISPQTPQLHYYLAQLRLKQNQAHAALQLALKGQSLLNAGDKDLVRNFWQLIGDCYVRLGNTAQSAHAYSHL